MHEQPNGKGDIEPSFNHTGVHNCNLGVRTELGFLVTEMDLKRHIADKKLYTEVDHVKKTLTTSMQIRDNKQQICL